MKREPAAGRAVVALRRTYKAADAAHKSTGAVAVAAANASLAATGDAMAAAYAASLTAEGADAAAARVAAEAKADLRAAAKCKRLAGLLTSDRLKVREAGLFSTGVA